MANNIGARVITDETVIGILRSRPSNDYWLGSHVLVVGRVSDIAGIRLVEFHTKTSKDTH